MSGSFLPSLWSSINHSLLGSRGASIVMKSTASYLPKIRVAANRNLRLEPTVDRALITADPGVGNLRPMDG